MSSTQKITTLKNLSILPFLFACIPIAFIYMFLREIPILSSLFVEYVNEGNSVFFPFLTSTIIVFQFTTGHLIDIIFVLNMVAFLERGGYYYYRKVCLKKNYVEFFSEVNFLDSTEKQEELFLNFNVLLGVNTDYSTSLNLDYVDVNLDNLSRINSNDFSVKNRYYSRAITKKHNLLDYVRNSRKRKVQFNNLFNTIQYFSLNKLRICYLPSRNNCKFSISYLNNQLEEGI